MLINNARTLVNFNKTQKTPDVPGCRRSLWRGVDEDAEPLPADYSNKAQAALQRYQAYAAGGFVSNDGNAINVKRITTDVAAKMTGTGATVFYHVPQAGTIDVSL